MRRTRRSTGDIDKMRVAELNYVLRFRPEYLQRVLRGEKRVTIRLGIVRPRFGELLIVCNNLVYGIAEVESIDIRRVEDIPEEVLREEGFRSTKELINELRKLYPEIKDTTYVTIIRFHIKEVFDRPRDMLKMILRIKEGYRY